MRRRALTLAELLLALGLMAWVIILVAVVMSRGLKWQAQSRTLSLSCSAGRDLLERIRNGGAALLPSPRVFDGRTPQAAVGSPAFPPAPYPTVTTDHETFSYVVTVTQVRAGLFSVRVDTYWDATHKTSLETYVR